MNWLLLLLFVAIAEGRVQGSRQLESCPAETPTVGTQCSIGMDVDCPYDIACVRTIKNKRSAACNHDPINIAFEECKCYGGTWECSVLDLKPNQVLCEFCPNKLKRE